MIKITHHIYNLISLNPKLLNLIQTVLFSSNINKKLIIIFLELDNEDSKKSWMCAIYKAIGKAEKC